MSCVGVNEKAGMPWESGNKKKKLECRGSQWVSCNRRMLKESGINDAPGSTTINEKAGMTWESGNRKKNLECRGSQWVSCNHRIGEGVAAQ
jgi:hypothetical protein